MTPKKQLPVEDGKTALDLLNTCEWFHRMPHEEQNVVHALCRIARGVTPGLRAAVTECRKYEKRKQANEKPY